MASLTHILRGRISRRLKERLLGYIEKEEARGRSITESDVVRDAVIEYLDLHSQNNRMPERKGK